MNTAPKLSRMPNQYIVCLKMGRSVLLTQMRGRLGSPRIRCLGKTDLFGEMSGSNPIIKFGKSLTQAKESARNQCYQCLVRGWLFSKLW